MRKAWLVVLALSQAALVAAAAVEPSPALSAPDALLRRYDLPGGQNIPRAILDEVSRGLEVPDPENVPMAIRLYGSAVYMAEPKKNVVDWRTVNDVDAVVYIDEKSHLAALRRGNPGKDGAWAKARHEDLMDGLKEKIQARLSRMRTQFGSEEALKDAGSSSIWMPDSGFETLAMTHGRPMLWPGLEGRFEEMSPEQGYHPHEPHFGNAAGISLVKSIAGKLSPEEKLDVALQRAQSLREDIKDRLRSMDAGSDEKLFKRFIQLALLKGDEEEASQFKGWLAAARAGRLGQDERLKALNWMRRTLELWRPGGWFFESGLRRNLKRADGAHDNLVVVP